MLHIFKELHGIHWVAQSALTLVGIGVFILIYRITSRAAELLGSDDAFREAVVHDRERTYRRVLLILPAGDTYLVYEAWVSKKTLKKGKVLPKTKGMAVRFALPVKAIRDPKLMCLVEDHPKVEYMVKVASRQTPDPEKLVKRGWSQHSCEAVCTA